jgi:antitoxin HigA-1
MKKITHPGKFIKKDYIDKYKLTVYQVSKQTNLSQTRISEIIKGTRSVTIESALKIGKFLGIKPETLLEMQMEYDLENGSKKYQKDLMLIKKIDK